MKYLTNLEKYLNNLFFQENKCFKNAFLCGLMTFFYLPIYGQIDFCAIRLDSAMRIERQQKRVEITAISTAESVDEIRKRLSTEGYKDKIQSERYDSCIIWVYFRTNDRLHEANALEQCYLENLTTACRKATLYGFQNNQLQDSVQCPDSQFTPFNLVPLTSINNEPKEWVLKMVMPPYSTDTLRSKLALYITSKPIFEADNYLTRSQCTLLCGEASELLPDLVLLRAEPHRYRDRHPGPADVHLLIEVADESLGFDRGSKLRAYAAAGIPEYWIVNVRESRVEVHREPAGEAFRTVHSAGRGDTLAPLLAESGDVPLADIFP